MTTLAWHFLKIVDGQPVLRDGRPLPEKGEWLEHDGPTVLCESGLHASERAIDALLYAPGPYVTRVECEEVVEGSDKIVCRRRRVIAGADLSEVLRAFARWCALSCLDNWPDPPQVVLDWLMTGDEQYRSAAYSAADSAAYIAVSSAARSAAYSSAYSAAYSAARSAASSAASSAARSATWSAAESAAWSTASSAAWSAAWSTAWSAANEELERLLSEALGL